MYVNLTWVTVDPDNEEYEYHYADFPIKSPSFSPQVDLSANSMPVGEYTVDVILQEPLPVAPADCLLYDELERLWCAWPVKTSEYISETCLRVTCASWLGRLEHRKLEAVMYTDETAEDVVADIFGQEYARKYTLSDDLKDHPISGFCPAQTARDRLQWLLFVLGAYTQDVFRDDVLITAMNVTQTETLIPLEHTFDRPTETQAEWVTGLKITAYTFRRAASEEEWHEDDSSYMFPLPWLATEQVVELTNPDAPSEAPPNVVEIDGIYLINSNNVDDIAYRLTKYWFNPTEVTLDCINNNAGPTVDLDIKRAYKPGDMVIAYVTPDRAVTGYIQQASFSFGLQARSTLKLVGCTECPFDTYTYKYQYHDYDQGDIIVAEKQYRFPEGGDFGFYPPKLVATVDGRSMFVIPWPQKKGRFGDIVFCHMVSYDGLYIETLDNNVPPPYINCNLDGPGVNGDQRFHIDFERNQEYFNEELIARTETQNPMTFDYYLVYLTLLYKRVPGTYKFYIDPGQHETSLLGSEAVVKIYSKYTLLAKFEIDQGRAIDRYWNVCQIDIDEAGKVTITKIDTYSDEHI